MRQIALPVFVLVLLFVGTYSCACSDESSPEPTEDVITLVNETVSQWLFFQITEDSWPFLSSEDAGWRDAEDLDALSQWFSVYLAGELGEEGLWDFDTIIEDVQTSGLYEDNPLTDGALLALIKNAIEDFHFQPTEKKSLCLLFPQAP